MKAAVAAVLQHCRRKRRQHLAKKGRILIVEDDYFVATELEFELRRADFEVVGTATTESEAFDIAGAAAPDLVVMDVRLGGGGDGVKVATRILKDFGIRSIFATAHADPATRSRGTLAQPIAWIQKPYRADEIIAAVKVALSL